MNIIQQVELENQIDDLEEENKYLLEEYSRLRVQLNTTANAILPMNGNHYKYHNGSQNPMFRDATNYLSSRSMSRERNIIEEAKLLRQHETRLEARMKILENHNRLLDAQLKQLRLLLNNVSGLGHETASRLSATKPSLFKSRETGFKYSTISAPANHSYKLSAGPYSKSLGKL
jgi:hypothetical protein